MIGTIKLSCASPKQFWEIPVLFEDADLLALNKPPGLSTAADPDNVGLPNLITLLHEAIAVAKPWVVARNLSYLLHAHRLDPLDSGVLLLAKSKAVLAKLLDLFGSEQRTLYFVGLAQGTAANNHFSVEAKIGPHSVQHGLMCVDFKTGKRARTDFEVIERFARWSFLRCFPITHRPHQVRVHLARLRMPLAGDAAYGGKPLLLSKIKPGYRLKPNHVEKPLLDAPCLHAEKLTIAHPVTGLPLEIEAPWPRELQVAIKYLRKYSNCEPVNQSTS